MERGLFGEGDGDAATRDYVCVDGGESFSIGVRADGDIVGWGSAFYGEFGPSKHVEHDGHQTRIRTLPTSIPLPVKCSVVVCGLNHVLALSALGDVFAWGRNHRGQAAQPPHRHPVITQPTRVSFYGPERVQIAALAAGGSHSLGLDANGAVYSWGDNSHGQLGRLSDPDALAHSPGLVAFGDGGIVSYIAAGYAHSAAIASNGTLFTFGWGLYHQLGHGDPQDTRQPCRVQALDGMDGGVTAVACGTWHTAALSPQGDVYTWGWGPDGQLGPSHRSSEPVPRVVDTEDQYFEQGDAGHVAMQIACGARFTVVLSEKGDVFCWGRNREFILRQNTLDSAPIHSGGRKRVAPGHSHAIMYFKNGIDPT